MILFQANLKARFFGGPLRQKGAPKTATGLPNDIAGINLAEAGSLNVAIYLISCEHCGHLQVSRHIQEPLIARKLQEV